MKLAFDNEAERRRVSSIFNALLESRKSVVLAYRAKRSWSASEKAMAIAGAQDQIEVLQGLLVACKEAKYE